MPSIIFIFKIVPYETQYFTCILTLSSSPLFRVSTMKLNIKNSSWKLEHEAKLYKIQDP